MLDRRTVIAGLGTAAATAWTAESYARIAGANDRLRIGVMGINSRGVALMNAVAKSPNCVVTHLIDIDPTVLDREAAAFAKRGFGSPKPVRDYRRLIAGGEIDALAMATPDHWHVRGARDAMDAGKHVYVEKPLGLVPREGELLIETQARTRRVLQMGNQQRSSLETRELVAQVREGQLGDIYEAQTWYANKRKSIGRGTTVAPPAGLDWELWQGPAPRADYRSNLLPYNWRWFWRYGTGETGNNALHELDIARWIMGVEYPERVVARGSRRIFPGDDWEMYDTMDLTLAYAGGKTIRWDGHSCNGIERFGRGRGVLVYGTKGSALVDRNGYEIFGLDGKSVRKAVAAAPSETTGTAGEGALDILHMTNFAETIRGRARVQASPVRDGHISTTLCHLANIAYRTGSDLTIDPATGRPAGADAMKLWSAEYAPGWDLKA